MQCAIRCIINMQYIQGVITHQLLVGYSEELQTRVSCLCLTEMSSHLEPKGKGVSIPS